jgi:adenosine/AMP kinase
MDLTTLQIEKPEAINLILGQTHFIKSVEDMHEALVTAVKKETSHAKGNR